MSTHRIIFAGFGGQGIQFSGKVIAYAGMVDGKEVSFLPSYGPEMRGGTSNCRVIVSDEPIGSPLVVQQSAVIAMNLPSLEKFEDVVDEGGVLLIDSSLITRKTVNEKARTFYIPATQIASDSGMAGLANMIMTGLLARQTGLCSMEVLEKAMAKCVPPRKKDMIEMNMKALEIGYNYKS